MAQNYVFMTDSDSDLLYSIADERNIPVVQRPYALEGKEYLDDNGRSGGEKAFFDKMRTGAAPVTSLLPTEVYLEYFEPILREKDLLFVAFSSKMSNTILNIFEAREQLLKKYPQRKFTVVDTLSISGPQTLDIKPVIVMGKGGKMDSAEKVQGRKKAIRTIVERTVENIERPEEQTLLILHADVPEEANRLAELLRQRIPTLRDIRIQLVGPVIGAHCGPGTLACCFMGKERKI